ncbi:NADH dehydrogenase subunit 5 [Anopheles sinensis]|uniref:NADH dehydrogenase subunit 5 n=1 Tax=Anopheles sinensis TaxID=74873 RepID=A0A084WPP9_ANOSI|nr:NADH dehydrogenase subunit 5 [Anopheles sinensis]
MDPNFPPGGNLQPVECPVLQLPPQIGNALHSMPEPWIVCSSLACLGNKPRKAGRRNLASCRLFLARLISAGAALRARSSERANRTPGQMAARTLIEAEANRSTTFTGTGSKELE